MKIELCLLVAAMFATESSASLPTESDLRRFYRVYPWGDMVKNLENEPVYNTSTFIFHQEAFANGMDFNLQALYLYNLDVPSCRTEPLQLAYNDLHRTDHLITATRLMTQYPCFRNGDRIAYAAEIDYRKGIAKQDAIVFKGVFRISNDQDINGWSRGFAQFRNTQDGWDTVKPSFFWSELDYVADMTRAERCRVPTDHERSLFKVSHEPVSGVGFDFSADPITGPEALQVRLESSTPGCEHAPITLYGPGTRFAAFPLHCDGIAIATWIWRSADLRPTCGNVVPLKIHIKGDAKAIIRFPNNPDAADSYWYEHRHIPDPHRADNSTNF